MPYQGQLIELEVAHDAADCPTKSAQGIVTLRGALLGLRDKLNDKPVEIVDVTAEPHAHVFYIRAYLSGLGEMDITDHIHLIKNALGIPNLTFKKRPVRDERGFIHFLEEELREQFPQDGKRLLPEIF